MKLFTDLPTLSAPDSVKRISSSQLSVAQKLLASSLVTQSRSFIYTLKDANQDLLVLDVTHFLNHRINTKLISLIGQELAIAIEPFAPDIILTAPSSGNIPTIATAMNMNPMPDILYAPKGTPITIQDAYHATSRSYTHGKEVELTVAKDCLPQEARVAICDDFLDTGKTAVDLLSIISQANAVPVGFFFVIEKPFDGRKTLKDLGYSDENIVSVINIESMQPGKLKLAGFDYWFELARI